MAKKKKDTNPAKHRPGTVPLDLAKIDEAFLRRGLALTAKIENCNVSRMTRVRIHQGEWVQRSTAVALAEFLECDVLELIVPDQTTVEPSFEWPTHPEWEIVEGNSPWERTSNGLFFFRCKVRHKHIGDEGAPEFGRARVYDLTRVPDAQRAAMKEHLTRHPLVCRGLSSFPYFPTNLSVAPVAGDKLWWVVDQWSDSEPLTEVISRGAVEETRLNRVMKQVAEGLVILHEHQFVLRELAPSRLLINANDEILFTDLDLAKVLTAGGSKTVSAKWPIDPYRAPEVEEGEATPKADIYSWGMIYLHLSTGNPRFTASDLNEFDSLVSKQVKDLLQNCLLPMPSKRPGSAEELLKAL